MAIAGLRLVGRIALLGCALGCVARHPGRVTVVPGCYALYADDWPAPAAIETGLSSLPSYIALDTTAAGPRGRRVIVPSTWEPADPNRRSAYWRVGDAGTASLVLNFLGPSGDFTAALQPFDDGYMGEGIGLSRGGARWPPQVNVSLVPTTCAGLVPGAHDTVP
ncbi:MAG TPA: hypothetical protein VMT21_06485 [Gemmatimonadales bacterium]|nr:hypothetical protein [Gemmatimonadales bacterium]